MIKNHMLEVKINVIKCKGVVKGTSYPSLGPHPVKDLLVMVPMVDILMRSLNPVSLSGFEKFNTSRSSRSDFSTFYKAFIKGVLEEASFGEYHRTKTVLTKCSTQTIYFEGFLVGVELQVGSKSRPYQAIIMEVMRFLMNKMEVAVKGKVSMLERRDLIKASLLYESFYGFNKKSEGLMMDAAGLWDHIGKGREVPLAHVVYL